jgi:hypothetical protein
MGTEQGGARRGRVLLVIGILVAIVAVVAVILMAHYMFRGANDDVVSIAMTALRHGLDVSPG